MAYNRPPGGFFDDQDDENPTIQGGYPPQQGGYQQPPQQGGYPPQQGAYPPQQGGYQQPYRGSEDETKLPGGNQGGQAGAYNVPVDPTRLPGQPAGGMQGGQAPYGGYMGSDETQLGEESYVGPLGFLLQKRPLVHRGLVHRLQPETNIGRDLSCQIRLADKRISRLHARIRLTEDPDSGDPIFIIIDMDAASGTYINDSTKRIEGRVRLAPGDEIKIGDNVFVFVMLKD